MKLHFCRFASPHIRLLFLLSLTFIFYSELLHAGATKSLFGRQEAPAVPAAPAEDPSRPNPNVIVNVHVDEEFSQEIDRIRKSAIEKPQLPPPPELKENVEPEKQRGHHIRTGSPVSVIEMSGASDEPPITIFAESPTASARAKRISARAAQQEEGPDPFPPEVDQPKRESFCSRAGKYFTECCVCTGEMFLGNCSFFFNPKWISKPTVRRFFGTAGFLGLYGTASWWMYKNGTDAFSNLGDSIAAFVVMNGMETALSFAALFMSAPKTADPTPPEKLKKLAVIIPVHGTNKNIRPSIESLFKAGIQHNQIFVMENTGGKYPYAKSPTAVLLQQNEFHDVHYHFIEAWGSKVAAEFLGAVAAKQYGFEYVMDIDDDVVVPPDFDPYLSLINDKVKLIAYPITPSNNTNYLTDMQKLEYQRAARNNYFKQNLGTVLAPHGAVNVSEIDPYLQIMRLPPVTGAFSAEDQRKGASFRRSNYTIAMAPGSEVGTEVPKDLATFWGQRVKSWDLGAHLCTGIYLEDLATDWPRECTCNEWTSVFFRKLYQIQSLLSNAADCVRPILLVGAGQHLHFWTVALVLWEANNLINMADDAVYRRHRARKQVCKGSTVLKSIARNHMSLPYTALQLLNGSTAAFCAWLGAGAASPEDYSLKKGYPAELARILKIENSQQRLEELKLHLLEVGQDPRDNHEPIEVPHDRIEVLPASDLTLEPHSPVSLNTIRRIYSISANQVISDVTDDQAYQNPELIRQSDDRKQNENQDPQ